MFAGVDVGASTSKAIIINENGVVLGYSIIPTSHDFGQAGESALKLALDRANFSKNNLRKIFSTGYGRRALVSSTKAMPEILCLAKGAKRLVPTTRTVIDIGGQDSKAIELDGKGNILTFAMNDRCAAGTGRFLEVLSKILNLNVGDLGTLSSKSHNPCTISSTCTVFAESEIVSYLASGEARENIVAGLHVAIAKRVIAMGKRIGISYDENVVFTGGVAKNIGVCRAIEDVLKKKMIIPKEPQIVGALGAALFSLYNKE